MATIELDRISKRFGEFLAVDDFSLTVPEGELLVLLGPSGCGKTTTLRVIAGFTEPSAGSVRIRGRDVTLDPPYRRNVGVVFQNYALFPHLDVFENVAFGLRRRRESEPEIARRVERALALVKLETLARRMPRQLSGGQQQRVALARALVIEPDVLLLDEPLSNLDAKLRHDVRQEMRRLQQMLKITTIMVTHDQDEAMSMGDRLVVMASGRIQQIGRPQDLYQRPRNHFVASFIGQANFLEGRVERDGSVFVTRSGLAIACAPSAADASSLMIRPEAIEVLDAPAAAGPNVLAATVQVVTYLGAMSELILRLPSDETVIVTQPSNGNGDAPRSFAAGQSLSIRIDPRSAIGIVPT
jgi:putative spermidine/putrescine transport system ATP-binding protein